MSQESLIVSQVLSRLEALTRLNSDTRPRLQIRQPIALDALTGQANSLKVSGPFTGFYVEAASDATTTVQLSLSSPESQNITNFTTLKLNDSGKFDQPIKDIFFTWAAQPGKTITIVLYLNVDFRPGSYLSSLIGQISVSKGTSVTEKGNFSLTSTAVKIASSSIATKAVIVQNLGATPVYIGDASVTDFTGANPGVGIASGASEEFNNTADLWAVVAQQGAVNVVVQS